MRRLVVIAACLGSWWVSSVRADEAHYLFPTELAAQVEAGARAGLVVGIERDGPGALVSVASDVRPLGEPPALGSVRSEDTGDPTSLTLSAGFAAPEELEQLRDAGLNALQAAVRVVEYVSARIALDEADPGAQDAMSVLERGRGRCSGRANAAVGLLRSLGMPARVVHGVVVGDRGARWHRWGEVWLGTLGWVPFDPGTAVGALSVRYVPMRGAGELQALGRVRLLAIDERGYATLPVRNGLRRAPQRGATVRFAPAAPERRFWTALYGPDGSRRIRGGPGELEFSGLLSGRYRVVWPQGSRLREAEVDLGEDVLVLVDLGRLEGS